MVSKDGHRMDPADTAALVAQEVLKWVKSGTKPSRKQTKPMDGESKTLLRSWSKLWVDPDGILRQGQISRV